MPFTLGVGHLAIEAIEAIEARESRTLPVRPALPPPLLPYELADGVGKMADDEDALAAVRGAEVLRAEAGPDHLVTELAESADNDIQAPPKRSRNVLPDDEGGALRRDEREHGEPEPGSNSRETGSSSGEAEVLTGGSSAKKVN